MLKKLTIANYRGYEHHEIDFRDLTIIVGKNNAGKSTLIEALRLLSLVTNKYENAPFREVPSWLEIAKRNRGISPSLARIDFSYQNIFYQYGEPPAVITGEFVNGCKIKIYFAGEKKFHAVIFDENGEICSHGKIKELKLPIINILPQITPLIQDEKVLNEDYVKLNVDSPTSSRHFRNQINYLKRYYEPFKELIESTWEGLRINEYNPGDSRSEQSPYLLIQEGAFTTEIGRMGHGLQMWMQTMWFLARCNKLSTVILDEPDVYMHADLQRKLVRLLKNEFKQVIVATHSIEIMAEVEPENILVIDRKRPKSIFASDFTTVQKILLNIGSIHNIGLARLWSAKKILIVEGNDIDILKRVQNTLFKKSKEPLDVIPSLSIGGWGGWSRAIGSKLMLKNAGDQSIMVYCILDRDYHTDNEVTERYEEAKQYDINLKIWNRKEIENFIIEPKAIRRIIERESGKKISHEQTVDAIDLLIEQMKEEYLDALMDKISLDARRSGKQLEPSTVKKKSQQKLQEDWSNKLSIVSGKSLVRSISNWSNETFGVLINSNKLAQELAKDEIPVELKTVIIKIEERQKF